MSEDSERPDRVAGGIHVSSVGEAAREAGATAKPGGAEAIDALREHCKRFIEDAGLTQHARMMALPRMDEMIFWIRSGYGRG